MKGFILLSLFTIAVAGRGCGKHQHYNSCGTSCPVTCKNYANQPEACNKMCNPGCHCDEGYVKTENGQCVKPRNCPPKVQDVMENTCLAKPEPGLCDAYFPMWYYDVKTESCKQFVYGGCGGNGNKYKTEEECMEHCEGLKLKRSETDICSLPFHVGFCFTYRERYYFNKDLGECIKFTYHGCGGNKNNFQTLDDCLKTCT